MKLKFLRICPLLALLFSHATWATTTDPSTHVLNLSGPGDGTTQLRDQAVRVFASGNNVHLFWYSYLEGGTQDQIRYRRSIDGGATFAPTTVLASSTDKTLGLPYAANPIVVDGANVHVFYRKGNTIQYIHSSDNGTTFSAAMGVAVHEAPASGDFGYYATASGSSVNLLWSSNRSRAQSVTVSTSTDGGKTFTPVALSGSSVEWPSTVARDSFAVDDLVRDGDNVYAMWRFSDGADYIPVNKMYISASFDGGVTFKPAQQFNVASANDGNPFYGTAINGSNYSPNLAAVGTTCHVLWRNYDSYSMFGSNAYSLRTRILKDGTTLSDPITLKSYPSGQNADSGDLGTIAAKGTHVYILTIDDSGTLLWSSADSGASYSTTPKTLQTGGWWPLMQLDPVETTGAKLHLMASWASYFVTSDGGATFSGPLTLGLSSFMICNNPKFAVGADGTVHWAAADSKLVNTDDFDVFYHRHAVPAAGTGAGTLHLEDTDKTYRVDNMQIAASPNLALTSALTVEFWVKPSPGASYDYCPYIFQKTRSGSGAYSIEIGTTNGNHLYSTLVTAGRSDTRYGDQLKPTDPLPANTWSHIALTYDAAASKDNYALYLNGVLKGKATIATGNLLTDAQPFILGDHKGACGGFKFDFAELRLWSVARTADQINSTLATSLTGSEAGLTAYYKFGNSTYDSSGHGNHGVLMYKETFGPAIPAPTLPDAGVAAVDGGVVSTLDGGVAADAGVRAEAGLPMGVDGGAPATTDARSDGGVVVAADARGEGGAVAVADAGARSGIDAPVRADGGSIWPGQPDAPAKDSSKGGGSCNFARGPQSATGITWLLACAALLAIRKRRKQ